MALEAVETAVIVVSAVNGVEPMTQRMMEFAKARGLCRLIVVNKIDSKEARTEEVLAEIREQFGKACLPLNLPADGGKSVVDCFFQPHGKPADFSSVEAAHTEIIDQVVEVDEELMALYLEQGEELSPEQLHDPFEKALREDHLVPICFCSAETGAGIPELLDVLAKLAPNPTEGNPPPFLKGEGADAVRVDVSPDPSKHVIAHVFKVAIDPFVGKLGVFRVHQGTVKSGAQLLVGDGRKPVKFAHIFQLQGKEHIEVPAGDPGRHLRRGEDRRAALRRRAARLARRGPPPPEVGRVPAADARARDPRREARRRAEALRGPAPPRGRGPVRARRAPHRAERDRAVRPRRPAPARHAAAAHRALRRAR